MRARQYQDQGTVLTGCGIPSRITCNQPIPGTYPWYQISVHPKKDEAKKQKKKYEKGKQERKRKGKKNETNSNMR